MRRNQSGGNAIGLDEGAESRPGSPSPLILELGRARRHSKFQADSGKGRQDLRRHRVTMRLVLDKEHLERGLDVLAGERTARDAQIAGADQGSVPR